MKTPAATPLPRPGSTPTTTPNPQQNLYAELARKVNMDLSILERLKGNNTTAEALQIVLDYDDVIHEAAAKYQVPAAMIETVMFREQRFFDLRDIGADFAYKLGLWNQTSTGVMQVQSETAINAINFAVDQKMTSYEELGFDGKTSLSADRDQDKMEVWQRLHDDPVFCIEVGTMNIRLCAEEKAKSTDFASFDDEDMIETFARYNGKGDAARNYGEECYHWYDSFARYEETKAP